MYQSIKKTTAILIIFIVCFACESKPTLETFYIEHEEAQGFMTLDVPTSFLDIEDKLTEKQKEAYDAVNKLNMLGFLIEHSNENKYNEYLAEIKFIFENPKYKELMRGTIEGDAKFKLMLVGDAKKLDEFILFGNSKERGFAIIRILGNDMNANDLVELGLSFKNLDTEHSNINEILNFFK